MSQAGSPATSRDIAIRLTNARRWSIVGLLFTASLINYFDRATITALLTQVGFHVESIRHYTHVVSADYLLRKVAAAIGPVGRLPAAALRAVPGGWRIPVNLGDNMHVVARRPA